MPLLLLALLTSQNPQVTVNGRAPSARELLAVGAVAPGAYWYDTATGAVGQWGGPTAGFIGPGLGLGGPLPANASGGGDGRLTGVFINGRELHPIDVQQLTALMRTPVMRGRWWMDAQGNAGAEGGPFLFNLYAVARASGGGGGTVHKNYGQGDMTTVTKGCAAVHGHTGSGESRSDYSYYVGCD